MKRYEDFFKEAQQYSTILKNYEENGEIFTDPNFHPDFQITEPKIKIDNENFTWRRIDEFYTAPLFKKEFIRPDDIDEGQLCDSGLIAVLAWTASRPERVRQLFSVQTPPQQPDTADLRCGAVVVQLHAFGKTTPILIDTRVPFIRGTRRPAFSRPRRFGCSAWFCLVEKAVAKMFGGYSAVTDIGLHRASYAVLGFTPRDPTNTQCDFTTVASQLDAGIVVAATAESGIESQGEVTELGIVKGGVYLVTRARAAAGRNFFVMRSPRASIEWLGGFSSTSVELTGEIRKTIGLCGGLSGTFCMIDSDFFSHFRKVDSSCPPDAHGHTRRIVARLRPGESDGCDVKSPTANLEGHQTFVLKIKEGDDKVGGDVKVTVTVEKWGPLDSMSTTEESGIDVIVAFSCERKLAGDGLTQYNHQVFTSTEKIFTFTFNVTENSQCVIVFNRSTKRKFAEDCYATIACRCDFDVSEIGGESHATDDDAGDDSFYAADTVISDNRYACFSDNDFFNYSSEDDFVSVIEREIQSLTHACDTAGSDDSVTTIIDRLREASADQQARLEEKVPLIFASVRSLIAAAKADYGFKQKVCDALGMGQSESGYDTVLDALHSRLGGKEEGVRKQFNDFNSDGSNKIQNNANDQSTINQAATGIDFIAEEEEEATPRTRDTRTKSRVHNFPLSHVADLTEEEQPSLSSEIVFDSVKNESENKNEAASNEDENSAKANESCPAACDDENAILGEESQVEIEVEFEGESQQLDGFKLDGCEEMINNANNEDANDVQENAMNENTADKSNEQATEVQENATNDKTADKNGGTNSPHSNEVQNDASTDHVLDVANDASQKEESATQNLSDKPKETEKVTPKKSRKLRSHAQEGGDLTKQPVTLKKMATKQIDDKNASQSESQTNPVKRAGNKRSSSQKAAPTNVHQTVSNDQGAPDSDAVELASESKGTPKEKHSEKPSDATREVKHRNRRQSTSETRVVCSRHDYERVSFSEPIKKSRRTNPAVGVKITIHDPDDQAEILLTKKTVRQRGDRLKKKSDEKCEVEKDVKTDKQATNDDEKKAGKRQRQKSAGGVKRKSGAPQKKADNLPSEKVDDKEKVKSSEKVSDKESVKSDRRKKDSSRQPSKDKQGRRASSVRMHGKRARDAEENEKAAKTAKPPTEVEISVAFDRPINGRYSSDSNRSSSDSGCLFFPFSATYKNLRRRRRLDYGDDYDEFNFVADDAEFGCQDGYLDTRLGYEREYFSLKTGGPYTNPSSFATSCRRRNASVSYNRRPVQDGYVNFLGLQSDQINCSYLPKRINWF